MAGEKSGWQTSSGLLDEFDLDVQEAWFGEDEEGDDDRIFLFLRGPATVDGEVEDEEYRERYSTGKNWEVVDEGQGVEPATGKWSFNRNSGLGRLVDALVALGDEEAELLQGRGQPWEAKIFLKLRLSMERHVVSKWKDDDGEEVQWELPLPVAVETTKKKSKAKGKSKKARSRAKKKSLRDDVIEFAGEFAADEHDEFVDQVLSSKDFDNAEQILEDDELHAEILDDESDLWAQAH